MGAQILEVVLTGTKGKRKAWEASEGTIVLESTPVPPRAIEEQAHPESSQVLHPDQDPEEPRTMKKIPVPTLEDSEGKKTPATPPAPPPTEVAPESPVYSPAEEKGEEEEEEPIPLSQLPPEAAINIDSLLTRQKPSVISLSLGMKPCGPACCKTL